MLLIFGAGHSDYELPQIIQKPREHNYSDKPQLIRSLKRQCCLQVFLSVTVTLVVIISCLLLVVEGKDRREDFWQSDMISDLVNKSCSVSDSGTPPAAWSQWSDCTRTCGGGFQLRSRLCPEARPLLGIFRKHECWYNGESAEIMPCNTEICDYSIIPGITIKLKN